VRFGVASSIVRESRSRRIATRYDKLARNYLSGVFLAATAIRWTNQTKSSPFYV
jgi:transposase